MMTPMPDSAIPSADHALGETALPRAILFDLDDTILAAGHRLEVLRRVAGEFASEWAPLRPDDVAERVEAALEAFWSDPARHKAARLGIAKARLEVIADAFLATGKANMTRDLAERFAARFAADRERLTDFFPGARETLEALKARGVRMALITNGDSATQRAKIERFSLAPLFDHIQIEGEQDFGKPDERAYRHAMSALGVAPHETWMVGDNLDWEVSAPQKLGVFSIWHDGFGTGLPKDSAVRPDRIIRAISELLKP